MTEIMKVDNIDNKYVYLITQRAGTCSSCGLKGACNLTGTPDMRIKALRKKDLVLSKGDFVLVKLPDVSISKLSFIVYGIPLLVFIFITIIMYQLNFGDIYSFLGGFLSMIFCFLIIGIYDKKHLKDKYLPEILKKHIESTKQ